MSSTLNEDGDFWIEGINDDKTTSKNDDHFTTLLDMEYNQIKNTKLSNILNAPQPSAEMIYSQDYVRFETSIDECNVANVNNQNIMDQFSSFLKSGGVQAVDRSNKDQSKAIPVDISIATNPAIPIASQSDRSQLMSQSQRNAFDDEGGTTIDTLERFLLSMFDGQVTARDIHDYACEMVAIGFDPDFELAKELEFGDLSFMKKLHRRFFWKEWQKLL